eukprot:CAMPEP_0197045560 /NCGR_PEP_ID=MMETSP1384-20130603/21393_1 /TAXON_ID=29189 /ORGANISM="Ammonia sp." /LENGTH=341 /DNA_ID=CAMNT_0042477187 /DNA_START=57 /DNA_END=1079 /DNA_ORIENTATION=-
MSTAPPSKTVSVLESAGYTDVEKIANTLQGSIWSAVHKSSKKAVAVKVTKRSLHEHGVVIVNNVQYRVDENILREKAILKYLSKGGQRADCIVQYVDSFKTNLHYYLVMSHGGSSMFDFVVKVHRFIRCGILQISEWHRVCKLLLLAMIECVEYVHLRNVAHLDVSLENFLLPDIDVQVFQDDKQQTREIQFVLDDEKNSIDVKLCDFGLAEHFQAVQLQPSPSFSSASVRTQFLCTKFCGKTNYQSPEVALKRVAFDALKNDVFCLGVCAFMMLIGCQPWNTAKVSDPAFVHCVNGRTSALLDAWNVAHYANPQIIELFSLCFQYEKKRATLQQLKDCKW